VFGRIIDASGGPGSLCLERFVDSSGGEFDGRGEVTSDILGVFVEQADGTGDEWIVSVAAMEAIREGALYHDIHAAFDARVSAVPGVREVWPEDTETWVVGGRPDPVVLLTAVAEMIDDFAPRIVDAIIAMSNGRGGDTTGPSKPSSSTVIHETGVFDDAWQCSCGAGGSGNWGEVTRAAREHDKATKVR
jgi:hypothetical protein